MALAVITIAIDPVLQLSDTSSVRYETIAVGIVLLLGLVAAAWIATRTPAGVAGGPGLRLDDLVFIAVGAVPGAIFGGRLGYVLDHVAYYQANQAAILDPTQGGLTLTLAVPFGALTGGLIARLLGAPVGRWMHAAALPLLFVLAAGKLVGVLGATGQGAPSDLSWATLYLGPGPWGALAPEIPSHPSQVYEAVAVAVAIVVMAGLSLTPAFRRRDGTALFVALALWSIARVVVGATWREPAVVGPLRVEQALAIPVLLLAIVGILQRWRSPARAWADGRPERGTVREAQYPEAQQPDSQRPAEPQWPDEPPPVEPPRARRRRRPLEAPPD